MKKLNNYWIYYGLSDWGYTCIYLDSSHHSGSIINHLSIVKKISHYWVYYDLSTLRYTCIYMDSSHHSGIKRDIILVFFLMYHKPLRVKIFICLDLSHHTETNSNLIQSEKTQQPTGNCPILALWDAHFLIIICLDLSYPTEINFNHGQSGKAQLPTGYVMILDLWDAHSFTWIHHMTQELVMRHIHVLHIAC